MVDIGDKPTTKRKAVATGRITMTKEAFESLTTGQSAKGDIFAAARIAGIMAAKKTGELVPLCHPLGLDSVGIEFALGENAIDATATASMAGRTGVEMEALTAVSVALLTLYDMGKSLDRSMEIGGIRLLSKTGGKSGDWVAAG